MLNKIRLQIMVSAVQIRMNNGEELEDILGSYSKLTDADKNAIREKVKNG